VNIRVRFIRPDVAVAHAINELSGLVDFEGRALPAHRELSIRVFVKVKGAWRVTAFHNTMLTTSSNNAADGVSDGASPLNDERLLVPPRKALPLTTEPPSIQ
jgi:hypothetical protein